MPWTPPRWLRNLAAVAREPLPPGLRTMTPAQRLDVALELMSFALRCVHEQSRTLRCTVTELRRRYETASARLQARV